MISNKIEKWVFLTAIFGLAFLATYNLTKKSEVEGMNSYKVDSLLGVNKLLEGNIAAYLNKIDSLQWLIYKKENKIKGLKKDENEKMHSIDTVNAGELYLFFSNVKTQ